MSPSERSGWPSIWTNSTSCWRWCRRATGWSGHSPGLRRVGVRTAGQLRPRARPDSGSRAREPRRGGAASPRGGGPGGGDRISDPCSGPNPSRAGFEEAAHALLGTSVCGAVPGCSPTTTSASTSTCCACRRTRRSVTSTARQSPSSPSTTSPTGRRSGDTGGVPRPARHDQRDRSRPLHPSQYAAAAAAPDHGADGPRPAARGLADGGDRRQARRARAGSRLGKEHLDARTNVGTLPSLALRTAYKRPGANRRESNGNDH